MASRAEVAEVLQKFKLAVDYGRCQFLPRADRNLDQDLIDLNLTRKQALDLVKSLTPENYSRGPEADDHEPEREVWVFGCGIDGAEVYIKLRLIEKRGEGMPRGAVWSFHKAEYQIGYPLREGKR